MVQNWPFFHLFILGNIGQENVFYDIVEGENTFLGYKNRKFKKSKNWDFGFGPKVAIIPSFYFKQYRPGKCVLQYSKWRKLLCRL